MLGWRTRDVRRLEGFASTGEKRERETSITRENKLRESRPIGFLCAADAVISFSIMLAIFHEARQNIGRSLHLF